MFWIFQQKQITTFLQLLLIQEIHESFSFLVSPFNSSIFRSNFQFLSPLIFDLSQVKLPGCWGDTRVEDTRYTLAKIPRHSTFCLSEFSYVHLVRPHSSLCVPLFHRPTAYFFSLLPPFCLFLHRRWFLIQRIEDDLRDRVLVAKLERGNDDNTAREEVRCPVFDTVCFLSSSSWTLCSFSGINIAIGLYTWKLYVSSDFFFFFTVL